MTTQRSSHAQEYRRLYNTARWSRLRTYQLAHQPLCQICQGAGRVTAATVVDHIAPHKGDRNLFFDAANLQSLCDETPWRCHSSVKQAEERLGFSRAVGRDGWPLDPRHPANSKP